MAWTELSVLFAAAGFLFDILIPESLLRRVARKTQAHRIELRQGSFKQEPAA
jgi:hypothetical protein